MGACGQGDKMLDLISEGLGFDSQCWPCVDVSSLAYNTTGEDLNPIMQIREMPCVMDFPRRCPSDCVGQTSCIPHPLSPPSRNGYLVHRSKVGSIVAGCCAPTARGGKV